VLFLELPILFLIHLNPINDLPAPRYSILQGGVSCGGRGACLPGELASSTRPNSHPMICHL
jgi:hypothetical protein